MRKVLHRFMPITARHWVIVLSGLQFCTLVALCVIAWLLQHPPIASLLAEHSVAAVNANASAMQDRNKIVVVTENAASSLHELKGSQDRTNELLRDLITTIVAEQSYRKDAGLGHPLATN